MCLLRIFCVLIFVGKDVAVMKTLREVACGQTVTVKKLSGEGPVKRRIMDMGITKGVSIFVRKVAPLGDPVEVTVRGYELSLRKADAEMIEVE
jgi:ferrous iron transport protein A